MQLTIYEANNLAIHSFTVTTTASRDLVLMAGWLRLPQGIPRSVRQRHFQIIGTLLKFYALGV